jgi:peptidoglycan/xylan/chitin deacetylase (PgdA/CDA1 family)
MRARSFTTSAVLGAAAVWSAPAAAAFVPVVARCLGIPTRLSTRRGVALTFDDGPHAQGTPAVLEALDRAGATATFFLVGEQVARRPALAAEIVAAGHEVGVHGYHHRLHLLRTPRALANDVERAAAVIDEAIGCEAVAYRPPYGVFSLASLELVRLRGLSPILWSRWGRDWEERQSYDTIARLAGAGLVAGDVVLLHDADHYSSDGSWRKTAAALPAIVELVAALGEPCVSVTQST